MLDAEVKEYLFAHSLPIRYRHGMNFFLDVVFDQDGAELAQRTYEEYIRVKVGRKEVPGCGGAIIALRPSESFAAFNRAEAALAYERRDGIHVRLPESIPPSVFEHHQGESDFDFACRLRSLAVGFTNKATEYMKTRRHRDSKLMSLYFGALVDAVEASPGSRREITVDEALVLNFAGNVIGSMIPDDRSAVCDFLSKMGSSYWQTLWDALLKQFSRCYAANGWEPLTVIDGAAAEYADALREHVRCAEQDIGQAYDRIRAEVARANPETRTDATILTTCGICLRLLGHAGNMQENVQRADGPVLRALFNRLAEETVQDSGME